jgi:hypothetical protein
VSKRTAGTELFAEQDGTLRGIIPLVGSVQWPERTTACKDPDRGELQPKLRERDMTDPRQILETANNILLVDWPSPAVPRALVAAGFTVFGFCPNRYSRAEVVAERPNDADDKSVFPTRNKGEIGFLVFRRLGDRPEAVDIVYVHRPVDELAGIVANLVVPLGAKTLWLESLAPSVQGVAREYRLALVEGVNIVDAARTIGGK